MQVNEISLCVYSCLFNPQFCYLFFISGGKEKDHIRYPVLTQQTVSFGEAIGNSIQCSMVRNRKFLLEESQIILALNREWKEYTK